MELPIHLHSIWPGLYRTFKPLCMAGLIFIIPLSVQAQVDSTAAITEVNDPSRTSGYINHVGIDFLFGTDNTTPRFHMMHGYQFSPRFSAGMGIGYIPYNDPLALIPLYLDFNYKTRETNIAPFLFLKAGYNISVHTNDDYPLEGHRGGWMFTPGTGIHFITRDGFQWYLNAGYNVNNARFDQQGWGSQTVETDLTFKRVMFGLGFSL